jgi:hypothetical protein
MKMLLGELRRYVAWELLFEVADVGALATRGLKSVGIVVKNADNRQHVIAVSQTMGKSQQVAHGAWLPQVVGSVSGGMDEEDGDGTPAWTLHTLYADDPSSMIVLLATALARWKIVVPDHSVSPAAQGVLKRYYATFKDDPTRITQCFYRDEDFRATQAYQATPWLYAAYLGPVPGFDASAAKAAGDKAMAAAVDPADVFVNSIAKVKALLQLVSLQGFDDAYADPDKTRIQPPGSTGGPVTTADEFSEMLYKAKTTSDNDKLVLYLMRALAAGENSRARKVALQWYHANRKQLDQQLEYEEMWAEHGLAMVDDPGAAVAYRG